MNNASVEHSLNDLIEIARDGQSFYEEAASKVQDTELSSLFRRIAAAGRRDAGRSDRPQ